MKFDLKQDSVYLGGVHAWRTPSSDEPNKSYVTVISLPNNTKADFCTCPGYAYRQNCRHLRECTDKLEQMTKE